MNNYLLTACIYFPPIVLKQTRARPIPAWHKAHGIHPLSVASQLQFRFFARYRVSKTLLKPPTYRKQLLDSTEKYILCPFRSE